MANSNNVKSMATSSVAAESQSTAPAWQPGFRQTPWSAMVLIFIMLACMGASAGIIIGSNSQTVASWKIEPVVLLAVLSSIWNYSIGIVLGISVAITWWRTALRGTTLESLHYIWNQGAVLNLLSALRSSAAARKVVLLAWLVISVQIANNPLLQRSNHIEAQNVVFQDTMTLDITPRLPDGWLGSIQNASTATIIGSRDGLSTVQEWWKNATIESSSANRTGTQCDGTCQGNVQGTGIAYSCTSTTTALHFSAQENVGAVLFAINTTMATNSTGAPILVLTTVFSSAINDSCMGTLNISTCSIEAAVVEYPIIMQNNTVTLNASSLPTTSVVSIYTSAGDLPTAAEGTGAGPLEGLNDFLGYYLAANATLLIDQSRNISLYAGGGELIPDLFFLPSASNYDGSILHKCGLEWADPTPYVLDSMQNFLFRASISASSESDAQTFSVQRTSLALVFQSNYSYLTVALAIMLIALLAVLWQLWGWWELGRQVSLSPLEIAGAFRALATRREDETAAVGVILELVGKTTVKYDGGRFSGSAVVEQGLEELRDSGNSCNGVELEDV
jgi:hypothetical protein